MNRFRTHEAGVPVFFVIALVLLVQIAGCGYGFRAGGSPVGIEIESLGIPLMTSTSSSIGFESDFTKVIRKEFISHSRVPVVPGESAHMVLMGHISDIRTDPLTYGLSTLGVGGEQITHAVTGSRRLIVTLEAELVDRETGRIVWRHENLTEEDSFGVTPDPIVTRHNERLALERIASRLAKRVYQMTMVRF